MTFNLEKNSKSESSSNEKGSNKFNLNKSTNTSSVESNFNNTPTTDKFDKQKIYKVLLVFCIIIGAWYFLSSEKLKRNNSKLIDQEASKVIPDSLDTASKELNIQPTNSVASPSLNTDSSNTTSNIPPSLPKEPTPQLEENVLLTKDSLNTEKTNNNLNIGAIVNESDAEESLGVHINKIPATFNKSSNKLLLNKSKINDILESLNKNKSTKITIEGFSSSEGSVIFNQNLSEQRAKVFMNYLISKGISKERIIAIGKGIENPIDSNDTESGRKKNRRVEVTVN